MHAPFVSDECIRSHIAKHNKNNSHVKILNTIASPKQNKPVVDVVFDEAVEFIKETGRASTSSLQRKFRIGFQRASNIIDKMEEQGIISEKTRYNGPREVLVA